MESGYTQYIMLSYRNMVKNDGILPETRTQSYSIYANYRHPIRELFGSLHASYRQTHSNVLYGYLYEDITSILQSYDLPNDTENYSISGNINQKIPLFQTTLTLAGSYSKSNGTQLTQGSKMNYQYQMYSLSPKINSKINDWAGLSYAYNFTRSRSRIKTEGFDYKPIRMQTHNARLNLFPVKAVTVSFTYEAVHNSAVTDGNRSMSFADVGVKYKRKKVEFQLTYYNILNSKRYISANYTDLNAFYSVYTLRPAEVLLKIRLSL